MSLCYGDTLEAIEQDLGARARAPNAEEGNAQVDADSLSAEWLNRYHSHSMSQQRVSDLGAKKE